ncbi:MAG: hypothetical protein KAJ31_04690 [Deltaproteobacteria bacterium]|nr:hypothetical protein [Deltaproteobacteria bacterium]
MRVYLGAFIFIIFVGSGLSSVGNELIAQNTNLNPTSVNEEYDNSDEDSYVCPDNEINVLNSIESEPGTTSEAKINACSADYQSESDIVSTSESPANSDKAVNENGEQISLLPNPEVEFVEEYMVKFDSFKSRDTIIYGGVMPFVAIPDSELANEDKFFNEESFSVFLYFKRKF